MRKTGFKQSFLLPIILLVMGLFSGFLVTAETAITVTANPSFSKQEGERSTDIAVKATGGTGVLSYKWKKDGVEMTSLGTSSTVSFNSGIAITDQGSYTCIVTDDAGTSVESAAIVATVTAAPSAPVFTGAIADMTANEGADVTIYTVATAWSPKGVCKWYKEDGTLVTNGVETYVGGRFSGPGRIFSRATVSVSGNYYCEMTNSKGSTKSNVFKLTVNAASAVPSYSSIRSVATKDSTMFRVTFLEGSTRFADYLDVTASGYTSAQWKKDGQPIATPSTIPTRFAAQDKQGGSWQGADAGTYTLDLTNSVGTITTIPMIVTIAPGVKPKFVTHTMDTTVTEADTIRLYGVATGVTVVYEWRKVVDGQATTVGTDQKDGTFSQYMSIADTGTYYCIAGNAAGYDTAMIHVAMKRTQPLPLFYNLKDQYDQGGSTQIYIRLIGELSETLTLCYIDGLAAKTGTLSLFNLGNPAGGTLSLGKHVIRFTNVDATLVLEKTVEIK